MTGAAAIALAEELGHLADLRDWPPVGERVANVLDGLRGISALSEDDVAALRRWSRRWRRLRSELRSFYAEIAPRDAGADRALRWYLGSDGAPPPDPVRWSARSAWRSWYGGDPSFDLTPRVTEPA